MSLLEININMRCIEIGEFDDVTNMQDKININMRCIEIMLLLLSYLYMP